MDKAVSDRTEEYESSIVPELPVEAQRVAEEVKALDLPFNMAVETASKTPDISWIHEDTYCKYPISVRSSDRRDRLIGNMITEHPTNESLYQNFSGK